MNKILFGSLLLLAPLVSNAQTGAVGIGTTAPVAGAALEIRSSTSGLLIPRLLEAQRTGLANKPQGLLVYQTDGTQSGFWYYSGTAWVYLNAGALNLPYADSLASGPGVAVSVKHKGTGTAILGITNATAIGNAGVRGNAPAGSYAAGVYGSTTTGYGVYGEATGNDGYGVTGVATDARGVSGASTSGSGVVGTTSASSATVAGVQGIANGGTAATAVLGSTTNGTGVRGVASASGGFGVTGTATDARGVNGISNAGTGVYGTSTSGSGIVGLTNANNLALAGVVGIDTGGTSATGVLGTTMTGYGVRGIATARLGRGVYGFSGGSGGIGVYGVNTACDILSGLSAPDVGVYGEACILTGYAGYFEGSVMITGNVSKSAGSFKIDHPLDPKNKYLYHSFVESPDMMNIYNGNIVTDAQGFATVAMPGWFEALNRDFRYQLTVIGTFAQAIIKEKMKNGSFVIQTSQPNVEVSWMVTGIRHDKYADAHRIPVEEEKAVDDRGYYLAPDVYGQPVSEGIGHRIGARPAKSSDR